MGGVGASSYPNRKGLVGYLPKAHQLIAHVSDIAHLGSTF
jgi:hypothetical protein